MLAIDVIENVSLKTKNEFVLGRNCPVAYKIDNYLDVFPKCIDGKNLECEDCYKTLTAKQLFQTPTREEERRDINASSRNKR